jgi:hypothetical protein
MDKLLHIKEHRHCDLADTRGLACDIISAALDADLSQVQATKNPLAAAGEKAANAWPDATHRGHLTISTFFLALLYKWL